MSFPAISVIVPVYDVEKYITRCIHSVMKQTFKDYELIIVNDCSPCNAISIIRTYFNNKLPGNVFILDRDINGGLGAARNTGIKHAKGKYLFFLDSDDWLEPSCFKELYGLALSDKLDIVAADFYMATGSFANPANIFKDLKGAGDVRSFVLNYNPAAWNKLYIKSLFLENALYFPDNKQWYEDVATIPLILAKAKTVGVVKKPLIYYYQRTDSIMGKTRKGNFKLFDIFKSIQRLIEHRRLFTKSEWISLEENLSFHAAAARLDDIFGITNIWRRYRFMKELYRRLNASLPLWKTSNSFLSHHCNFTGNKKFYKRAHNSFAKGKLINCLYWSLFIEKETDYRQKILLAIPTLHLGGAEKVLLNMIRELDEKKLNVTVYVYEQTGVLEKFIPRNKIKLVHRNSPIENLYNRPFLGVILDRKVSISKKLLKTRMTLASHLLDPDYSFRKYVVPGTTLPYKTYDIAIAYTDLTPEMSEFILKSNSVRKIIWIHNDFNPKFLDYVDDHSFEKCFNRFDKIVCVSSGVAESLTGRFSTVGGKVNIINNFLDVDEILKKSQEKISDPFERDQINLISVSRIDMHTKGYDRMVPILARLSTEGFKFKWYIIGNGPDLDSFTNLVNEYKLEKCIKFLGSKLNPYPYIRQSDCLLLPSRFEAFPTVVLEAHILGTPCIVARNAGCSDQFKKVRDLIVANDDKAIYEGLRMFLGNAGLRARMKSNLENYKYDNLSIMKQLLQLFEIKTFGGTLAPVQTDTEPRVTKYGKLKKHVNTA